MDLILKENFQIDLILVLLMYKNKNKKVSSHFMFKIKFL